MKVTFEVHYTDHYPDELPDFTLNPIEGTLEDDEKEKLLKELHDVVRTFIPIRHTHTNERHIGAGESGDGHDLHARNSST